MALLQGWFGDRLKREVVDKTAGLLVTMGDAVAARARELCPKDSGYLESTIGYTFNKDQLRLQVHADAPYAFFVEFGTRLMPAQPFLRPALLSAKSWGNRKVNTEMQFAQINTPGTLPMPRANSAAIASNDRTNRGIEKKFGRHQPKVVFHGHAAKSLTGYDHKNTKRSLPGYTPAVVSRFGGKG